ncbi:unnamed protein product [Hymenolepis diminuta]|uniref:DUF5734 domain-containing protein n=1 Tax=Hymenolepis diminuta TaxID=6216 RepID=A0A0R3SKZ8_HYMDI|nr:unnamed protein product [Hymenolepis diminuta]VUZ42322.1 unnamed protein product [Hymenolepis diminuta]
MAPSFKTEAQCLEAPMNRKTLKHVAKNVEHDIGESPFFKVVVKKSKIHMKPSEKGVKKLKTVNLKKVGEMHVVERADMVTLAIQHKKKNPVCLAVKFRDTATRKEFQDLAKRKNPQIKLSTRNYDLDGETELQTEKEMSREYKNASNKGEDTIKGQNHPPRQQSREPSRSPSQRLLLSKPDYSPRGGGQRPSSRHRTGSICSHCHQVIIDGLKSNDVEHDLYSEFSDHSMSTTKLTGSHVYYIGPNGSTVRVYRPRNKNSSFSNRERSRPDVDYDNFYENTSINSNITERENVAGRKEIGTITHTIPRPSRRRQILKRTPLRTASRERNSRNSNRIQKSSTNKGSVIYLIWDSSGEEDSDYEENEKIEVCTESSSNYSDSLYSSASEYSDKSKSVQMLLRALHTPANVRFR